MQETQNNIFAYYFQQTFLESGDNGWLGSIAEKEERWNEKRKNLKESQTFNNLLNITSEKGIDKNNTRLYAMINLLNKTGLTEPMSKLYKNSRRDHYNNYGQTKEADLIAKSFSEASGYNVIPYLEAWYIDVSDTVKTEIENKGYPYIYFLKELVTDANATMIKNEKGLQGLYSLVTEDEISDYITNKKGTVVFPFNYEFYNFFSNSEIVIKKGTSEVKRTNVTNNSMSLELPVGIYIIEITNTELVLKQKYVKIQEEGTVTQLLSVQSKNFDYRIDDNGDALITKYYGNNTYVEIPSKIYNYNVIGIDDKAFKDNIVIQEVIMPTTVTSIGKSAFQNCENLITIKDLANVVSIGERAFDNCIKLTIIENLKKVSEIGSYAFYKCSNLETSIDLKNITKIGDFTFYLCKKLPDIGDLSNVITIGKWAFSNCKSLTSVIDLTKVTSLGELAFDNCNNLTKVEIGKFITTIGDRAFYLCNNLTIYGYGDTVAYTYANNNNINFVDLNIETIEVKKLPTVTSYIKGEALNLEGGIITIKYKDETTEDILMIYGKVQITGYDTNEVGEQIITIKYKGHSTTFNVKVTNDMTEIEIVTPPSKLNYVEGENFDPTGMEVQASYQDGEIKIVTEYEIVDGENLSIERTNVTISYTEGDITKTTTQEIVVEKEKIDMTSNEYQIDTEKLYISKIQPRTTIKELKHKIETNAEEIKITKEDNEELVEEQTVGTGMTIQLKLREQVQTFILIVNGDINGDSEAKFSDMTILNKFRLNKIILEEIQILAADVNFDGKVDFKDLVKINKYRLNKIITL